MGLGGTARKLQTIADMAEKVYTRLNEVREQVAEMRETVTETGRRVGNLEAEVAEQRAILEAIAETEGIDLDAVTATAHIDEAESSVETDAGEPDADENGVGENDAGENDGGNGAAGDVSDTDPVDEGAEGDGNAGG